METVLAQSLVGMQKDQGPPDFWLQVGRGSGQGPQGIQRAVDSPVETGTIASAIHRAEAIDTTITHL